MRSGKKGITAYLKESAAARLLTAALFAFAGVLALPWMFAPDGSSLGYTNSVFSLLLFLAFFWLWNRILRTGFEGGHRRWTLPLCLGAGFSFAMVFGAQLDQRGRVPFQNPGMWLCLLILGVLATLLIRYFWDRLYDWLMGRKEKCFGMEERSREAAGSKGHGSFFLTAGIIFLCYLPVFLAVYPGFFVYDAQDEYLQVVTRSFSTHHPLMHVLLLGGMIHAVYKITGSYNLGIACYTLFQMAVMAGIFGWFLEKMKKRGMAGWCRILCVLYFGLCPVLAMFSLCSAKDGLFTGMLLMMTVLLQELCADAEKFFQRKGELFLLAASSLGMMLLRHNGFYGFLVFIPLAVLYLKGERKKVFLYFVLIGAVYMLMNGGLTRLLQADASENQEMLTVPISQLARVYGDEKEVFSEEEKELLFRYLPQEALERYTPKVTDGVKIDFNNAAFQEDPAGFFKLWFQWGAKHPFTYLNAWFMTSYGFWYPDTVIDVYRGNSVFTFTYGDSSYFGYEVEEPGVRESKLPWLNECYRKLSLEITQQKIPVVSMLFSPGFLFWITAFFLGFLWYGRWERKAFPFVLPFLIWLTVILGPTYLVRYVVFLWAQLPLLLWEVFGAGEMPEQGAKGEAQI